MKRLIALALVAGCHHEPPRTVVRYAAASDELLEPERGFVTDVDLAAPGDLSYVRDHGMTLGFAAVRLDPFRDRPISDDFLAQLSDGFAAVRKAGIKVIVRFVYNRDAGGSDATRDQIFAHIWQLAPILDHDADVIAVLDAGFIGAWGEWHTSIHNLDNGPDRSAILGALLAALPTSRSVIVRSPVYKKEMFGAALDDAHAFDGSPAARVGHLNGCFLASDSDLGTYPDPIEEWKAYVEADGRYTPVGGETCKPNPPRSDCPTATAELARLHWSFVNSLYHPEVLAAWQDQDCYDEIAAHLGYRLELTAASFDQQVAPGGTLRLHVDLTNTGYAAMFNARPVIVLFDDLQVETTLDPRRWLPGPIGFTVEVPVPSTTAPGRHRLALWLPDAAPSLRDDPRYAVQLVNATFVDGVNVLGDAIVR
jgi:hypothetical protein